MNQKTGTFGAIDELPLDLFGCSMNNLAMVMHSPEANEVVTVKCRHCETLIDCRKIVSPFVACDPCIERIKHNTLMENYRDYWEKVCPKSYRESDLKHEHFPRNIWFPLKKGDAGKPGQNYFLYGATGQGKTRVAFLLLKQALLRGQRIGVLWPEKISTLKTTFKTDNLDRYAAYDVLLMDDSLLTACRESEMVDSLKMLVDIRLREQRPMIMTSQIGEEDVQDGKQYGDAKPADLERIAALMRRLRESCVVVSFAQAKAADGEKPF